MISVMAENNADNDKIRNTNKELEIVTKLVDEPTFSISSGTYATTKELTIIYPENTGDYIYKYDVTIPNGEEIPTKVLEKNINQDTIEINSIMTVRAYIEKNNEVVNENSIIIDGIDIEPPKVNLVIPNINDWTKAKTLTIEATDNGVGLALRPYAFDEAKNWNKNSELTIATSMDLYIHTRDRLGNISNEFTINGESSICNTTTKICKIDNIDSLGPDISIEIVSGTNKNGYYIDDVKLKVTIVDKYLYNGVKVTGGVGFDENSLKITKNGTLLETQSNQPLIYYVTLKENIAVNDVIKVVAADKLGNTSEATKEVKIDRQAPILSTYQSQIGLNTGVDYPYTNNISAKYGPLGGSIVCNPTNNNVMVGTKTTVNCTATGNNGLVSTISFIGAHQYPATYVPNTCSYTVCTESGCCEWSWDGGCNSTGGVCTPTQDCIRNGCCSEESRSYDCSYYTCPNGGRLSGTTCVF